VSRSRTERLVNLVICLLSTRRYLTAAQIATIIPGYEHDADDPRDHEAFQRKFERDKAELRDLGVPLETGTTSAFEVEPGYRIARRDYALPEIHLDADEATAVGLAARLWQHAEFAAAATSALAKLRAAGIEVDRHATLGIEPIVTVDPAFAPVTSAVRARRTIVFSYRVPQADESSTRSLQPWGVVAWGGRWYVVGHDLDRDAPRCFRLSRVVGPVRAVGPAGAYQPPEVDLIQYVARKSGPVERHGRATVLLRRGRCAGIRRWAEDLTPHADGDRAVVRYADPEWVASWLVGYGDDVVVLGPPEVRQLVVERLCQIAEVSGRAETRAAVLEGAAS
jgi:proteasome accessory factor B